MAPPPGHVAHHYHLGTGELKRTTLAKANETRTDTVFSEIVVGLRGQVSASLRKESKELMYLLEDQLSIELAPARHRMIDHNFSYKPRDRVNFTGLDIVFFTQQWVFKFSHAAAEKLMLYPGSYGQP